jgi:hypothetical protein
MAIFVFLAVSITGAQPVADVPPALDAWKAWVLHAHPDLGCPCLYNDSEHRICRWSNTLMLDFDNRGGYFQQTWDILLAGWVPLPGDDRFWPQEVTVNAVPAAVVGLKKSPGVFLPSGRHTVKGVFVWHEHGGDLPQSFPVPETTGLIDLTVAGRKKSFPFMDENYHVWIQEPEGQAADGLPDQRDQVDIRIFRLIEDTIPLQMHNQLRLTVSGTQRRMKFGSVVLNDFRPVSVKSPLPVQLTDKGDLWVELRPGQWEIQILSVKNRPVTEIGPLALPYDDEIWAFSPRPNLRRVRVEGVPTVDPSQTTMPSSWKHYTSFRIQKDAVVKFREIHRGSPGTSMDTLHLKREIWLDFEGGGGTIRDRIQGHVEQRRFLGLADDVYHMGRLVLNGKDQLVTRFNENQSGIEIEKGNLELTAISRIQKTKIAGQSFPVGWNNTFQSAHGLIHIPPGWQLLGVQGAQTPQGITWLDRWSLLDFFLILIISFSMAKLWRWWWGLLFTGGLCLIWHEAYAPQYVWLHLVIVTALIRLIQKSDPEAETRLRMKLLKFWQATALLVLVGCSLIFVFLQLRAVIYPQLALSGFHGYLGEFRPLATDATAPQMNEQPRKEGVRRKEIPAVVLKAGSESPFKGNGKQYDLQAEPDAAIQTGPGIPHWQWQTISMDYGQIEGSHPVTLYLLSPFKKGLFCLTQAGWLLVLVLFFFKKTLIAGFRGRRNMVGVLLALSLVNGGRMAAAADTTFPPQFLLDELETRLTMPDNCFPHCADIPEARIVVGAPTENGERSCPVKIMLEIHAAVKTAVPLPSGGDTWRPVSQMLDGVPHTAMVNQKHHLWTWIPQGVHHLEISGTAYADRDILRVVFPLSPRFVDVTAPGWKTRGLDEAHQVGPMLVLMREQGKASSAVPQNQALSAGNALRGMSDFLQVRRHLYLGLEWRVVTEVSRLAVYPGQKAIVAAIPLLKNERVRSEFLKIRNHQAYIEMAPDVNRIEWVSSLPITPALNLSIPDTADWAEVWNLDASSLWHYEAEGLPHVYREYPSGISWYPWPGEALKISIDQLPAAAGSSLTIDTARMDYFLGRGYNRIVLKLAIRTSQGELYPLQGPEGAGLKHVKINGQTLPLLESERRPILPLKPGRQDIEVEWRQPIREKGSWLTALLIPRRLISPRIDLTHPVHNIDIFWHLPVKYWLLTTHGPRLGPALLTWTYIVVIALAAVLLGRFAPSPLKTRHWFLLSIGMATVNVNSILLVALWFIAIERRGKKIPSRPVWFNLMQIGLVLWSVAVLSVLYQAVQGGLLGIPDMQVTGNGSHATLLHWTVDRADHFLPQPYVISWSVYVYRGLMFCWALWLAVHIVSWAKWAVETLRYSGAWHKTRIKNITNTQ